MSNAAPASGNRQPPNVVNAASALLYLGAAAAVGYGLCNLAVLDATWDIVMESQADRALSETTEGMVKAFVVVVFLVLAGGLATLGVFVRRGKNPARIATWIVSGLVVLCCGCYGLLSVFSPTTTTESVSGGITQEQLDRIAAATPDWASSGGILAHIVLVLSQVAVIILLALPAANEFFRRPPELWVPPSTSSGPPAAFPPYPPVPPAGPTGGPTAPPPPPPSGEATPPKGEEPPPPPAEPSSRG